LEHAVGSFGRRQLSQVEVYGPQTLFVSVAFFDLKIFHIISVLFILKKLPNLVGPLPLLYKLDNPTINYNDSKKKYLLVNKI